MQALKKWLAKTFGIKVKLKGVLYRYRLTFGGAGNQYTEIDDTEYATYWFFGREDWKTGDTVTFTAWYAPLPGRYINEWQADNIRRVPK